MILDIYNGYIIWRLLARRWPELKCENLTSWKNTTSFKGPTFVILQNLPVNVLYYVHKSMILVKYGTCTHPSNTLDFSLAYTNQHQFWTRRLLTSQMNITLIISIFQEPTYLLKFMGIKVQCHLKGLFNPGSHKHDMWSRPILWAARSHVTLTFWLGVSPFSNYPDKMYILDVINNIILILISGKSETNLWAVLSMKRSQFGRISFKKCSHEKGFLLKCLKFIRNMTKNG